MLRVILYGEELKLAPRPRDKNAIHKWKPVWAVKLRVKAVTNGFLGMSDEDRPGRSGNVPERGEARRERDRSEDAPSAPSIEKPLELLKGIFGR